MKNLTLVAVILHLVITIVQINGDFFRFGDIIMFAKDCGGDKNKDLYYHYAIYVGKEPEGRPQVPDVGQDDNDIFHITGITKAAATCQFGTIENTRGTFGEVRNNFLDGTSTPKPEIQDIVGRITEAVNNCQPYHLTRNNFEHLPTFVHYGRTISQPGVGISQVVQKVLQKVKKDIDYEVRCLFGQ